jgi:hypothetical protein
MRDRNSNVGIYGISSIGIYMVLCSGSFLLCEVGFDTITLADTSTHP